MILPTTLAERLADLLGSEEEQLFPEPAPTVDVEELRLVAAERGALAAWQGLRRTAEAWHPVVKDRGATVTELRKHEGRLELGVRRYMRRISAWVEEVADVLLVQPASISEFDWDIWPPVFLELTRQPLESIMSQGGEDAKKELRTERPPTGTARSKKGGAGGFPTPPPARRFRLRGIPHLLGGLSRRRPRPLPFQGEPAIEVDWTIQSPQAQEFLSEHGLELARGMNDTTIDRLRRTLITGQREGLGIPQMRRRIQAQFTDMATWRARLIAQTETIRAYSEGAMQVYREAKVEKKKWLNGQAGADPICLELDGQVRGTDEDFNATEGSFNAPPAHPGCRCAVRAVLE